MSDRRLRELERLWLRSRSHDVGVRYLRERLRLGLVSAAHLEVAALCGDGPAQELLQNRPLVDGVQLARLCAVTTTTIRQWTKSRGCPHVAGPKPSYDLLAVMAWRRSRIALFDDAESATRLVTAALFEVMPEAARRAMVAAAWAALLLEEDVNVEARALIGAEAKLVGQTRRRPRLPRLKSPSTRMFLRAAVEATSQDRERSLGDGMYMAFCSIAQNGVVVGMTKHQLEAKCRSAYDRLWGAIEAEVVPWALGTGDPIAARVARRRADPGAVVVPEFHLP